MSKSKMHTISSNGLKRATAFVVAILLVFSFASQTGETTIENRIGRMPEASQETFNSGDTGAENTASYEEARLTTLSTNENQSNTPQKDVDYVGNEVIVEAPNMSTATAYAKQLGGTVKRFSENGFAVIRVDDAQRTVEESIRSDAMPTVSYNVIYHTLNIAEDSSDSVPTDPYYTEQYFHSMIDSPSAWNITKGSEDVVVALIDTGIDVSHPEFAGRISPKSCNIVTEQVGAEYAEDDINHGTHVAGIIAAAQNNGQGGCGIAPNITIMAIKANDKNSGTFSNYSIADAIYYAAENGADIINMSLGAYEFIGFSAIIQKAVRYAYSQGVTLVAAAGNESYGKVSYPAAYQEVIAVSSVDDKGKLSSFSNYGSEVDLAAPGSNVYSTNLGDGYTVLSGTSMASPVVAGVAALIKSQFPELSPAEIKQRLLITAQDRSDVGRDDQYGYGIVNAYTAVSRLSDLHRVTFVDGTRTIGTEYVKDGGRINQIVFESKDDYWLSLCRDAALSQPFDCDNDTITDDTTLFLKWTPVSEGYEYTETGHNTFSYSVSSKKEVTVTRYNGTSSFVTVPSKINGMPVTKLWQYAFSNNSVVVTVNLPNGLISIGQEAFNSCTSLRRIRIPDTVKTIGERAFIGCRELTSVRLSNSLSVIPTALFSSCVSLQELTLPESLTAIRESAFNFCKSITELNIPKTVTVIQAGAFKDCSSLKEITVDPQNPSYRMKDGVLFNKDGTELLWYPVIGDTYAYTVPETVTTIKRYAFCGSRRLKQVKMGNTVTVIEDWAFFGSSIQEAEIPTSITQIQQSTFANCASLLSVRLHDGITSIGMKAFQGCTNLTEIALPKGLSAIELWTFADCGNLSSVMIPNSVTTIGAGAFENCPALLNIYIPKTVSSFGDSVFEGTPSILLFGESGSKAQQYAQENAIAYKDIDVLPTVNYSGSCGKNLKWSLSMSTGILDITGTGEMTDWSSEGIEVPWKPYRSLITQIRFSDGLTAISAKSFDDLPRLRQVVIPEGVVSIAKDGFSAFGNCINLVSVSIPSTVTQMTKDNRYMNPEEGVFAWCEHLQDIHVSPDNKVFASIDGVLYSKDQTELICYPSGREEEYFTVPTTVKIICSKAFSFNKNLKQAILPEGLIKLESQAFTNCSELTAIAIPSTVTTFYPDTFLNLEMLSSLTVSPDNRSYRSVDGVVFNHSMTEIISYPQYKTAASYTIPETVTAISNQCFNGAELEELVIPKSVKAFRDSPIYVPPLFGKIRLWKVEAGSFAMQFAIEHNLPYTMADGLDYAITYRDNGGIFAEAPASSYTGGAGTVTLDIPFKDGYAFAGWYENPSFTGRRISEIKPTDIGDKTFYAKWTRYRIRYYTNGGAFSSEPIIGYDPSASAIPLPFNLTKDGYDFAGWYDNPSFTGRVVTKIAPNSTEHKKFYAKWTVAAPTVTGVTLNKSSLNLKVGRTSTLVATVTPENAPDKSVVWKSSNTSVATVSSSGKITAKKVGTATISVTTEVGGFVAKCVVKVTCAHKNTTKVAVKATTSKNGKVVKKCSVCGTSATTTVYYPKTIKLSATSYAYDGKVKSPTVTVKDSAGKTISSSNYSVSYESGRKNAGTYDVKISFKGNYSGTKTLSFKINPISYSKCSFKLSATSYTYDGKARSPSVTVKNARGSTLTKNTHYTVTYASGRKYVGTYKVTIKMKGNYTGTKTLTFKINPVKTTVSKLTPAKTSIKVSVTKKTSQVTGYEIQYSTSKTFSSYKTKNITSYKTTSVTLSSLKSKTTYYVRVRTYKTVSGKK